MDTNGCNILNDSNFALFLTMGGVVCPHGGKMKNWRFFLADFLLSDDSMRGNVGMNGQDAAVLLPSKTLEWFILSFKRI